MHPILNFLLPFLYVQVPQLVVIENIRLGVFRLVLLVAVIIGVILNFIYSKQFLVLVKPDVTFSFWHTSLHSGVGPVDPNGEFNNFCLNKESYEFQYDDEYSFRNITCLELQWRRRATKDDRGLFFRTSLQEISHRHLNCTEINSCPGMIQVASTESERSCACETVDSYLLTGMELQIINLNFGFSVSFSSEKPVVQGKHTDLEVKFLKNAKHVEYKYDDEQADFKIFGSDRDLELNLREILDSLGIDLDNRTEDRNLIPEGQNLALRLKGLHIILDVVIVQHDYAAIFYKDDPSSATAYIIPRKLNDLWQTQTEFEHGFSILGGGEKLERFRQFSGVKVHFKAGPEGQWGQLNFTSLLVNIAAAIVFLGIPTFVVGLFARNFLGRLSDVIETRVHSKLNVRKEIVRAGLRVSEITENFRRMTGNQPYITRAEFYKHIPGSLNEELLNPEEIDNMQEFIYDEALRVTLIDGGGKIREGTQIPEVLSLTDFVHGIMFASNMQLSHLSAYFDLNYTPSMLERIFTSSHVKKIWKERDPPEGV